MLCHLGKIEDRLAKEKNLVKGHLSRKYVINIKTLTCIILYKIYRTPYTIYNPWVRKPPSVD